MVKYMQIGATEPQSITSVNGLKTSTAPYDPRFPNQNQTRYCYVSFVDFQRCKKRHDENHEACQYFKKCYTAMCPKAWVEKWNEQLDAGTFPKDI